MTINDSGISQIRLVATEDNVWRFTVGECLQLTQPALDVDERLFIAKVEYQQKPHRVTEERVRQTTKPAHSDSQARQRLFL